MDLNHDIKGGECNSIIFHNLHLISSVKGEKDVLVSFISCTWLRIKPRKCLYH